jgi:hypothetical protein
LNSFRNLFTLGRCLATPAALRRLSDNGIHPLNLLLRHVNGDWGDLDADDRQTNVQALLHGARIFSAYGMPDQTKVWVITEADRMATTILCPSDY